MWFFPPVDKSPVLRAPAWPAHSHRWSVQPAHGEQCCGSRRIPQAMYSHWAAGTDRDSPALQYAFLSCDKFLRIFFWHSGVRVIYQPVGKTTFTIGGIETFQETARRNRLHAVTKVLEFKTVIADERLASLSGFSVGDELWYIRRVRYLDGKALILDINYFLTEFVHGLTPEIAANSIYDYIENTLGMQIITSKRRITVEHATAQDEKVLAMDSYDCVAVVTNQTFNASGMLFEFTQSRHQPDYFCFQDIATRKK